MARAVFFDQPVPYARALEIQEALVQARYEERIPDTVLFLEHPPVITLGRRGRKNFLLASREALAEEGIELIQSSRGGDVTWHGPGQLVMYPILNLTAPGRAARRYLSQLEETAIATCRHFGVEAFRREAGMEGAWTEQGKIAAIGLMFKRWISFHGMSFNVAPDLQGFAKIVPCGLENTAVTSLEKMLGDDAPGLGEVRDVMAKIFFDQLEVEWERVELVELLPNADKIPRLRRFKPLTYEAELLVMKLWTI
jgi:lipoyl(octanoyl) transferase